MEAWDRWGGGQWDWYQLRLNSAHCVWVGESRHPRALWDPAPCLMARTNPWFYSKEPM